MDYHETVEAVCSTDYGKTIGQPVALGLEATQIYLAGGVQAGSLPAVAIAPPGDAIYAAFVTHQSGAAHSNVVLATSSESGRVGVSAFALNQGRVDMVLIISEPHRPRFDRQLVVTSQSFDPTQGAPGGGKHGAWGSATTRAWPARQIPSTPSGTTRAQAGSNPSPRPLGAGYAGPTLTPDERCSLKRGQGKEEPASI